VPAIRHASRQVRYERDKAAAFIAWARAPKFSVVALRDLIARLLDVERRLSPQRKLGDIADADHTPLRRSVARIVGILPDRTRRGGPTETLLDQAEINGTGIGTNVDRKRNNIPRGQTHQFGWPGNLTIDAIEKECLDAR
jgi:hypothetical protein